MSMSFEQQQLHLAQVSLTQALGMIKQNLPVTQQCLYDAANMASQAARQLSELAGYRLAQVKS